MSVSPHELIVKGENEAFGHDAEQLGLLLVLVSRRLHSTMDSSPLAWSLCQLAKTRNCICRSLSIAEM